jgi:hypothetical protein
MAKEVWGPMYELLHASHPSKPLFSATPAQFEDKQKEMLIL